jgi:hypothetical protein
MAVSCKVGRPYHVADICFSEDPDLDLYDQFYRVCRSLTYFETVILARALKVDIRTVRRWQSGQNFPVRRGRAVLIIGWVSRGKPQKIISQAADSGAML